MNQTLLVVSSFALVYFLCELGQMVTNRFGVFNTELYRCHWYFFPIKIQRMLMIFMLDTQQPVFIKSSGNIMCTCEVFKKVAVLEKKTSVQKLLKNIES